MARLRALSATALLLATGFVLLNCGSSPELSPFPEGEIDSGGGGGGNKDGGGGFGFVDSGGGEASRPCVGLECQQVACSGGGTTSLSGKVYAPEGTVPLYNAIVYVPNSTPEAFKSGVVCEQCGAVTGSPVTTALTNEKGEFKLQNVPVGDNIPLVIQIGKWRRQITIPQVAKCVDTPIDAGNTRLPRTKAEGDIPLIGFTSGNADSLECFLRKLGIADSEFTPPTGNGRVHFYRGNGSVINGAPAAETLWNDATNLKKYDINMLSCEGSERTGDKSAHYAKMKDYLDSGGRVFASHFHYVWFRYGTAPLPTAATWSPAPQTNGPYQIDTDFPKGVAFADWLQNVNATTTRGVINLSEVRDSIGDSAPAVSRRWIRSDTPKSAKYFTFNTPIGQPVDKQCGRAVFTDVHVSGQGSSGGNFPNFCNNNPLNANEKALIFLFFDLSSCVGDDTKPPIPPPAIPK